MPNFGHRHGCGHSLFPSIWVEFAAHIYAMSYSFTHIRMSNVTSENPKVRLQRCMIMAPLSTRNFGKCPQSFIWKTSPGHSISKQVSGRDAEHFHIPNLEEWLKLKLFQDLKIDLAWYQHEGNCPVTLTGHSPHIVSREGLEDGAASTTEQNLAQHWARLGTKFNTI